MWTFDSKVMSLLFNMMSRFDTAFLPRIKLLISWLQSPSAVILESKKIRSVTVSTFSPYICHEVMGLEGFPGGFVVKNSPAVEDMQEMLVRSLGPEVPWRRAWQPTSVLLPGESHGQRRLAGYSSKGRKESHSTEVTLHTCMHDGTGCHDPNFLNVEFQASFYTFFFYLIKRLFCSCLLSAVIALSSAYLRWFIFLPEIFIPAWHFTWCTLLIC